MPLCWSNTAMCHGGKSVENMGVIDSQTTDGVNSEASRGLKARWRGGRPGSQGRPDWRVSVSHFNLQRTDWTGLVTCRHQGDL